MSVKAVTIFLTSCILAICLGPFGALSQGEKKLDVTSFLIEYVHIRGLHKAHVLHGYNESTVHVGGFWWSVNIARFLRYQREAFISITSLSDVLRTARQQKEDCAGLGVNTLVFVAPLSSEVEANLVNKGLANNCLRAHHWLLLCPTPCWPTPDYVYFPLDNVAVIAEIGSLTTGIRVTLWDAYQPAPHLPQRVSAVGYWRQHRNLGRGESLGAMEVNTNIRGPLKEPWALRTNLTGLVIRCSSMEGAPHTYLQDYPNGTVKITGIYGDLWDVIRDLLNFTEDCRRPPDGGWGTLRNDGSWTGMIGELVKGEADIAVAPLDRTYDRSLVVDYPFSLSLEGYVLVIKRPTDSSSMWNNYLREFTPSSWLVGCVVLVVMTLSLLFVMRTSPSESPISLSDAAMVVIGALCQTGTTLNFNSRPSRITVLTIFVTCVLVYMYYTSFLISALTVKKITLPFRNLQEMYDKKTYTFGFPAGGSVENYFRFSSQPLYAKIWNEIVVPNPNGIVPSTKEGLDLVMKGRHVHLVNEIFFLSKYFRCDYLIIPGDYFRVPKTWPIRKDSPLYPIFNYQMISVSESGLLAKSLAKWMPKQDTCQSGNIEAIGLSNVMTAFLLLGTAIILTVALAVLERFLNRRSIQGK